MSGQRELVDREKVCPLLLRCFWQVNRHNSLEEYSGAARGILPTNEVQIYTWKDATLRELTELIKDVVGEARGGNKFLNFSVVYPDRSGKNVMKPIGRVHVSRAGPHDDKMLSELEFQTGDYLDVCISHGGRQGR